MEIVEVATDHREQPPEMSVCAGCEWVKHDLRGLGLDQTADFETRFLAICNLPKKIRIRRQLDLMADL